MKKKELELRNTHTHTKSAWCTIMKTRVHLTAPRKQLQTGHGTKEGYSKGANTLLWPVCEQMCPPTLVCMHLQRHAHKIKHTFKTCPKEKNTNPSLLGLHTTVRPHKPIRGTQRDPGTHRLETELNWFSCAIARSLKAAKPQKPVFIKIWRAIHYGLFFSNCNF